MKKLPKIPKGLNARIAKEERLAARDKAIADRKKMIATKKAKLEALKKKRRGY